MTDKPATLSLDASEWRGLLMQNLVRAHEFAQSTAQISPEHVRGFHDHLDRMKALVSAWHLSAPPAGSQVAQEAPPAPTQVEESAPAQANGEARKKRGGWPLGKPRKRQAPQ